MEKVDSRLNVTSAKAYLKPDDDIPCKNCIYRNTGKPDWYKKAICEKYDYKPLGILYDGASCEFFKEDAKLKASSL